MTMSVSTLSRSDWMPCSAWSARSLPSNRERPRHDAHGERAELAADLRDDGRAAGSSSAAFAGRDEHHVRALERFLQLVSALLRRGETDARVRAGAEAARRLRADVDLLVRLGHEERLRVRVDRDELDARDTGLDHPRDRVRAAAADADDLDDGEVATLVDCSFSSHLKVKFALNVRLAAHPSLPRVGLLRGNVNEPSTA